MNATSGARLLERGYPYLRTLTPPRGGDVAQAAAAYARGGFHARVVAADVARACLGLDEHFTSEDAQNLVRRTLGSPGIEGPRFVLEALVGTENLFAWVLHTIETERREPTFKDASLRGEVRALGMMLRRLAPDARTQLTSELRRVIAGRSEEEDRALHIVTGGAAAVRTHGLRSREGHLTAYDLIFADDDEAFVASALVHMPIDETVRPNVRLAFLGGEHGCEVLCERVLEFSTDFWPLFEEDFPLLPWPAVQRALVRLETSRSRHLER